MVAMGKTIEVAADRAYDPTKTVLPAEMARGTYMQHAPRLQALKVMHLMIAKAGGRMADDVRHRMRLSEVREIDGMKNHDRTSLTPLLAELAAAVLITDDQEKQLVTIGGLVDEARIDYREEASGDLLIEWTFRSTFRRMAAESNHWAILDRQTVFHLGSKYAVLLFQHIASLANLNRLDSKTFSVPDLRAVLGVPVDKLSRFSNLMQKAISPAIAEINQLSRLTLTATANKVGRSVVSVTINWQVKDDPADAKRELMAAKVGRKARRDGTAETVAPPAPFTSFPETGGITYSPAWIAVKQRAGCNMDNQQIASDFRRFCREKGIALNARNIETTFEGFCRKVGKV